MDCSTCRVLACTACASDSYNAIDTRCRNHVHNKLMEGPDPAHSLDANVAHQTQKRSDQSDYPETIRALSGLDGFGRIQAFTFPNVRNRETVRAALVATSASTPLTRAQNSAGLHLRFVAWLWRTNRRARDTMRHHTPQRRGSSALYIVDQFLVPRITEYGYNNDLTDVDEVISYLTRSYPEYKRKQRGTLQKLVQKAIQVNRQYAETTRGALWMLWSLWGRL